VEIHCGLQYYICTTQETAVYAITTHYTTLSQMISQTTFDCKYSYAYNN